MQLPHYFQQGNFQKKTISGISLIHGNERKQHVQKFERKVLFTASGLNCLKNI